MTAPNPPPEPVLTVTVGADIAELVSVTLFDHGATAVGEADASDGSIRLRAGFGTVEDATSAAAAISRWATPHVDEIVPSWHEQQRSGLRPITVGRFWIAPPWDDAPPPDDRVELRIDPGRAFGHGDHPSTRLLLELLPAAIGSGDSVIDLGTGTGVLAIAAATLGARVLAVDDDPDAIACTVDNVERNGVADRVTIRSADASLIPIAPGEVVLANVTVDVQRVLAPTLRSAARALVSGLLERQVAEIVGAFPDHVATVHTCEGWAAIDLRSAMSVG